MPSHVESRSTNRNLPDLPTVEIWTSLVQYCIRSSTPENDFVSAVQETSRRLLAKNGVNPHESRQIVSALLSAKSWRVETWQLTSTEYTEALLKQATAPHTHLGGILEPADVLQVLSETHLFHRDSVTSGSVPAHVSSRSVQSFREEQQRRIFDSVVRFMVKPTSIYPENTTKIRKLLRAVGAWMSICVQAAQQAQSSSANDVIQIGKALSEEDLRLRESVAVVTVATVELGSLARLTTTDRCKEAVEEFAHQLNAFAQLLHTPLELDPQRTANFIGLADRIENAVKRNEHWSPAKRMMEDKPSKTADYTVDPSMFNSASFSAAELQLANVQDLQFVNTRAGNFVWLEAILLLHFPPTNQLLSPILHSRPQNDVQAAALNVILASFDLLAVCLHRSETANRTLRVRSFIVNRLPQVIAYLQSDAMQFFDAEFVISSAFARIDPSLFASGFHDELETGGARSPASVLLDTKNEFMNACVLHNLVQDGALERLGGIGSARAGSRKRVELLMQEYNAGQLAPEKLIANLELMDGNAGAYALATAQIFQNLCLSKDTSSLRPLCIHLCRSWAVLVSMSIFVDWRTLLRPVCQMLNDWSSDDHQGEFQPVYDEFSACLLLVMSCVNLFNLTAADLGVDASLDNFVRRQLRDGSVSIPQSNLSSEQGKHLGLWIRALFETEGISDDVMSACSPQEFYSLVPTLVRQSIYACRLGVLSSEKLRNGFELLLESFSMPSLVFAIRWLVDHLWESRGDLDICLFVLNKWVRPNTIEGEKRAMHEAVMEIIRQPVVEALTKFIGGDHQKNQVLLDLINEAEKSHVGHKNTLGSSAEIRNWTSGNRQSLMASFRGNLSLLLFWNSAAGMAGSVGSPSLPHFSVRHTLTAVRYFGAARVFQTLVDEVVKAQSDGIGEAVLDVISTILCAADFWSQLSCPDSSLAVRPRQGWGSLSIGTALRLEMLDAAKLITTERERAEAMKRLLHRLEMGSINLPVAGEMRMTMSDVMNIDLGQSIDMTQPAANNEESQMDFGGSGDGLGLDIDTALSASAEHNSDSHADPMVVQTSKPMSADDDIFADLGPLDEFNDLVDFS